MEYRTDNKRIVTEFFYRNRDRHFTTDAVKEQLESEGSSIPKSSLYRIIGNLCRAGIIRRFESHESNCFVYQYANFTSSCDMHFHLKCIECGKLIHLECKHMNELKKHIIKEHGFIIGGEGIINGICEKCMMNREKKRYD